MYSTHMIICALLAVSLAEDPLRADLKSPKAALSLYSSFKADNHLAFSSREDRMRFKLFIESVQNVTNFNEDPEDTAHYVLNMFSSMTAEEKKQYEGLNVTEAVEGPALGLYTRSSPVIVPLSKDWTTEGGVTKVKNQGKCQSCWAFAAVAAAETHYWAETGVLRNLAEQEYLDCAYEHEADVSGCTGGWMSYAYAWSSRNGGRLASQSDYPYTKEDGICQGNSKTNALVGALLVGSRSVRSNEEANIAALANGPVAVAVKASDKFHAYGGNIMRDTTCESWSPPSHTVTLVGYTPEFVVAKNSWGSEWGDSGFIRLARGYHNCGLWKYSVYPVFQTTGITDRNDSDAAITFIPSNDVASDCKDKQGSSYCETHVKPYCRHCHYSEQAKKYCKENCAKTCEMCESSECPGGTVRCYDGVCRHEHMC